MLGQSIKMHITYDEPLEIKAFAKLLNTVDKSFGYAYDVLKEKYRDIDFPTKTPARLKGVKEGSIWLDLLTNICADIAAGVIVDVLVDYLRNKLSLGGKKTPKIYVDGDRVDINIVSIQQTSARARWSEEEERLFIRKAVETYVVHGLRTDPEDFMNDPALEGVIERHGTNAVQCKLKSIKAVFEDLGVNNTLDVRGIGGYSDRYRDLVAVSFFYSNVSCGGSKEI